MNLKPEELVKALRCTATPGGPTEDCETCPYYRSENLNDELKEKLGTDVWTSCDTDKVGMDAAEQIERDQKEIAELRENQRRIPVAERMPEPDTEVLLIAHGWSERMFYIGSLSPVEAKRSWLTGITNKPSDWSIWGWSYLKEPNVTHWMPLPEPTKEVD